MGEVYRARDPRLDRDVAIKILRASVLLDPDWRARFTHEAKAVSALSHPHIVTIHDIGTERDIAFMVMEFVQGQTLDRMIPASGVRVPEALRVGAQIADACARAHAAGIVHRDLKPANVMVQPDGRVKVLDFGIAKLLGVGAGVDAGMTSAATGTSPGVVLGTAAYMSPEQAEGRAVDARSDIFSLGAMLYEMVTGQRPFAGDSPVTVMAAVVQQEPRPIGDVRPGVPTEFVRLVTRCLRKDPARRVQSMADLKVALEELRDDADSGRLMPHVPTTVPVRGLTVPVLVAAVAILAAAGGLAAWIAWRPAPAAAPVLQPVPLTSFAGKEAEPTLSPDGSQLAFSWDGESEQNADIYVMSIGGGSPLRLTTDPRIDFGPQWSPDGRRIAFLRATQPGRVALVLIPPLGGQERTIGEFYSTYALAGPPLASVVWSPDSRYLVLSGSEKAGVPNGIIRVNAESGEILPIMSVQDGTRGYASPSISPDGRTLAITHPDTERGIELMALSPEFEPRGTKPFQKVPNVYTVHWTPDGRELLFTYFINVPLPLSRVPAAGGAVTAMSWMGPGVGGNLVVQGRRMVFERLVRDTNIMRLDLQKTAGPPSIDRIAQSSFRDVAPQYSADGSRLTFYSNRSGSIQIWTANADGSQATQLTSMDPLATTGTPRWSPDGREIVFDSNTGGFYQVYVIGSTGGRPRAVTSGAANCYASFWSRDGRWIYFGSNRSGTDEVWRVPANGGAAEQVTKTGGSAPQFSPDGKWLYFTRRDGLDGLWRMPTDGGTAQKVAASVVRYNYAVTTDGVYYIAPTGTSAGPANANTALYYVDLASGGVRQILAIDKPVDLGVAISPDHRYLLFAQVDYAGQDLMLVENFK